LANLESLNQCERTFSKNFFFSAESYNSSKSILNIRVSNLCVFRVICRAKSHMRRYMKTIKGSEPATLVIATAGGGATELLDDQIVNASLESVDTLN
jgi:hypothetical protein